jgi:hypothetical protein
MTFLLRSRQDGAPPASLELAGGGRRRVEGLLTERRVELEFDRSSLFLVA